MSSVDDRIVNMQFNNKQFTQGAADSQRALQSLDQTIAKTGSGGGMDQMASSVEQASSRFGALKIAGVAAIATIASKVTSFGLNMVKSLTLDPLTQGFQEYQTNLNSIQTIMANTGLKGKEGLDKVNVSLNDLNHYSDQTIYNFSQMASSIGKFTAAGVPLKDATDAIKGMANSAALSGSDVQQLNTAMYQMSQALSTGTIRLMDWNSLANAGMGGKNMRESLMATNMTLKDHGAAMQAAMANGTSFRDSLQAGWLSAETFTKTMKIMAGQTIQNGDDLKKLGMTQTEFEKSGHKMGDTVAFTVQQLKGMGYSEEAAKKMRTLSSAAIDSATKVKTMSQALDVVKESVGSGFAKLFQDLFGNFNEATKLWTGVTNTITGSVSSIFGAIDNVLVGWRNLGGYQELWGSFANIFKAIGNLFKPIIAGFQAISPGTSKAGAGLFAVTHALFLFTGWIEKATEGVTKLTPVFVAVGHAIGFLFGVFKQLGGVAQQLGPIFSSVFDRISGALGGFADKGMQIASDLLGGILQGLSPEQLIGAVTNFAQQIIDTIKGVLGIHSPATTMIEVGINIVAGIVKGLILGVPLVIGGIGKVLSAAFDEIKVLFSGFDAMDFASLLNAILTGSLLVVTRKVVTFVNTFQGFGNNVQKIFDGVGNSLEAWQSSLKAKMILEIAIAIGILALSLIALSQVEPKKLAAGLGAISVLMYQLSSTLEALTQFSESDNSIVGLATALLIMSVALVALAGAVKILGGMDLVSLAKGLGAVGILLTMMTTSLTYLAKAGPMMEGAAGSMLIMAIAMNVLAGAVALFGHMGMDTLAVGFGALGIALFLMVGSLTALTGLGPMVDGAAGSMLIMAVAMNVLAGAVALFGNMDMKTLAKGFGAVGVALTLMVGSLLLLSGNTAGVVAGAGAMAIMAASLLVLSQVIATLGALPLKVIAVGLATMAVGLTLLLVAGAAAMLVAPGLEALGLAALALGAALFLAGAGMAAFGTGFALLAATGAAGTAVLIGTIHALLAILPEIAVQAAAAFIAFLKVIANASGQIRPLVGKIMSNMLGVINDNMPKIIHTVVLFISELLKGITRLIPQYGKLISQLIKTGLNVITQAVPRYIAAGTTIILKVLQGFADKIPKIVGAAGDLIAKFIKALGDQANKIIDAAGHTILKFLDGLDKAINKYSPQISAKGVKIAGDLVSGIIKGILNPVGLDSAIATLADHIPGWAKKFLGINSPSRVMVPIGEAIGEGMALGMQRSAVNLVRIILDIANKIIAAGDKAVLKAEESARKAQARAYAAAARADIKADQARDAARVARQNKKNKAAQKRAKALQKQADEAKKHADTIQKQADRSQQHVESVKTFQEADLHGKGDIMDQHATALADKAQKALATANAEAARARELMKTNRKAGQALLEQSRRDAREAANLAKRARADHKKAQDFYAEEVDQRIKAMEEAVAADKQAKADQAAFDAADAQGKSDILTERAKKHEAEAAAQRKLSEDLIAQAKKIEKTDAAGAMKLLDKADAAAQAAQAAADQAEQERKDAESALTSGSSGGGGTTGSSITPSASVLEDAARAVDRYTKSLQDATDLAAAQQNVIQFVQNNTSPAALSASEIYRQSKNLLSAAEVKMGVTTSP